MTDEKLTVIERPTETEELHAFPVPEGQPWIWREVEPRDCDVLCGNCERVIARGMTLLDLWNSTTAGSRDRRIILRCTCGAHLSFKTKNWTEPLTVQDVLDGTQKFRGGHRPKPKRPEPDTRRK